MSPFDLQPHLIGDLVELRPLRPEDWADLFHAASDPAIWEQHPASDRYTEQVFRHFFSEALASGGAFVVIHRETGQMIGSSRYAGCDEANSEIEIGWTFLVRSHWGGAYNGEMKRLMLGHGFHFVENVIFLVGATNVRSRRALEKIGAALTDRHVDRALPSGTIGHVVYKISK